MLLYVKTRCQFLLVSEMTFELFNRPKMKFYIIIEGYGKVVQKLRKCHRFAHLCINHATQTEEGGGGYGDHIRSRGDQNQKI